MKTINTLLYGVAMMSAVALSSCSDSFLDRKPLTNYSALDFWKTSTDATQGLASCYSGLQENVLYNGSPWGIGPLNLECLTDNGGHFNWSGWMPGFDLVNGTQTPNSSIFSNYWAACYEVISRCNTLLAKIEPIQMDEKLKEQYKAEAKVIRALMYNHLTMTFQDVPFITTPQNITNYQIEKTNKSVIVKAMIEDLKEAAKVLPEKNHYHFTKGAALALLGRVYLYNEMWNEAIQAYKEVMALGIYALHPSFHELFTQAGEHSSEIIMAISYDGPGKSEGTNINAHWNAPLESMNGTLDLVKAYYCKNGKPCTVDKIAELKDNGALDISKPNLDYYVDRDPRMYATLFVPGMKWNGKGATKKEPKDFYGGAAPSLSTVYVFKYFNPGDQTNSWDNGQDFYVIRYAEVLLSLAEAMVQSGNYNEEEVRSLVNQVRQRADVNMPKVEDVEGTNLSKEALLNVVKHERRVELAFEGLRLYDLYRWKELEQSVKNIEAERTTYQLGYEKRNFAPRNYVWPIPTADLDTNKKLVQHELWK